MLQKLFTNVHPLFCVRCKKNALFTHVHLLFVFMIFVKFLLRSNDQTMRCRHTSGRTSFKPYGNVGYVFVRTGNILACRVALLLLVCSFLGLRWILEQPSGSCLDALPRFQQLWALVDAPHIEMYFNVVSCAKKGFPVCPS